MFERFTDRARGAVVLAQEEARTLKHNYIGTEHILLGLLSEQEGVASQALASLDITAERVRAQILRIVGVGDEQPTCGWTPFTPRTKKVLELALREALSLGQNFIGTEHLLLGLVRENDGLAVRILHDLDADSKKIRKEVTRMLSRPRAHDVDRNPLPVARAVRSPVEEMDSSWLDFTPAEAFDLAMRLAPLSSEITFEVRRHGESEPTFRVCCRLTGSDDVLRELVALEGVGIRAVLDGDRAVRLGHLDRPGKGEDPA